MTHSFLRNAVCLAGALAAVEPAFAQQSTQTVGMHAPPAPGKVVVDGKFADWDLSGSRLMCYDVAAMKDRLSGTVAFMWDADCFDAAIHWRDPSPMVNGFDPLIDVGNAWKGDCVQLRIKTDRIAHVSAWYHAKTNRPGMGIHWGSFEKTKIDPDSGDLDDAMAAKHDGFYAGKRKIRFRECTAIHDLYREGIVDTPGITVRRPDRSRRQASPMFRVKDQEKHGWSEAPVEKLGRDMKMPKMGPRM